MKVVFNEITGETEKMLLIILTDDSGAEIEKYPIYVNKEMSKRLPVLGETLLKIKDIMSMIYNSGKNNENIEFETHKTQM